MRSFASEPENQSLALQECGLHEVRVERHSTTAKQEEPPGANEFSALGRLGAYVIRADKETWRRTEAFLESDYHLVPDVALSLPATESIRGLGNSARVLPWPAASGVQEAHDSGVRGGGVIIAMLDTGCDCDHVQFTEREKPIDFRYFPPQSPGSARKMRGFDPDGHGTHVAGILAGKTIGIAPEADLLVAGVIESESTTTSLRRVVAALEWISAEAIAPGNEERPVILNLSLGFDPSVLAKQMNKILSDAMRDLLATLCELDVLPVVAIGNDGPGSFRLPGGFPEVLAAGAVNDQHVAWQKSGSGAPKFDNQTYQKPDLAGYGVQIYSSYQRTVEGHSKYAKLNGTSMAAPYVTGIAALMAQQHQLRGHALRTKLLESALLLPDQAPERVGAGLARFVSAPIP
jgi:subtilisin family serine protease